MALARPKQRTDARLQAGVRVDRRRGASAMAGTASAKLRPGSTAKSRARSTSRRSRSRRGDSSPPLGRGDGISPRRASAPSSEASRPSIPIETTPGLMVTQDLAADRPRWALRSRAEDAAVLHADDAGDAGPGGRRERDRHGDSAAAGRWARPADRTCRRALRNRARSGPSAARRRSPRWPSARARFRRSTRSAGPAMPGSPKPKDWCSSLPAARPSTCRPVPAS